MANVKITALAHLSSTQLAPEDVFVIDDVSALITHKVTVANVHRYITTASGNAKQVENNLNSYASFANANSAALAQAIASINTAFVYSSDTGIVQTSKSNTIVFSGRQGITTSSNTNELVITLANTGVLAGTYGGTSGSTTQIPVITVDSQGRLLTVTNTQIQVDLASTEPNINLVQNNVTALSNTVNLTIGNLSQLTTQAKSNLVAAINEAATAQNYDRVTLGGYTLAEQITNNVSAIGATVFSMPKTSHHFAKLLINVEDLTYGQFQSSELLLVQDGNDSRIVEYGIVFTSTNPIASYETMFQGDDVIVRATTTSSDNRVRVLKITT